MSGEDDTFDIDIYGDEAPEGQQSEKEENAEDRLFEDDYDFNYTLQPYDAGGFDPWTCGAHIASQTKNLKIIIALRPNTVYPTVAAKALATLDQLSKGRAVVHFIAGGSDQEQAREGDFLTKAERYERLEEYIAPALADTSPSFLELRIDLDCFGCKTPERDWADVFGGTSIRRLTLLLHMRAPTDAHEVSYVLVSLSFLPPLKLRASRPSADWHP